MRSRRFRKIPNLYLIIVLFIMYLPTFIVVAYSFSAQNEGFEWAGLKWYPELFASRRILEAMSNSLTVAVSSCLIAAVVGTLGAVALVRRKLRRDGFLEAVSSLPIMLPEVVMGLAFLVAFSLVGLERGILALVLAHSTFCIPYVLILVKSRLAGLDPSYEEAARDLGASPVKATLTIVVPLVMPAIISGVFLAFAMSLDDFIISFFVSGAESTTYPVYIYGYARKSMPPTVNAMCTVMLGATLLSVALSQLFKNKKS